MTTLKAKDFTQFHEVENAISDTKAKLEAKGGLVVSDLLDNAGNQYVDLVLEGGGVLGVALLGYIYALEEFNVRFLSVGGASAGSIVALLLAAVGTSAEKKAEKLIGHLVNVDMGTFVDGDDDAKDFINAARKGVGPVKLAFKGAQVIDNLRDDYGLNPGDAFEKWLAKVLSLAGIDTLDKLQLQLDKSPIFRGRDGAPMDASKIKKELIIVTSELTTETRVELPKMAPLWEGFQKGNPARMVRASMSIPGFFHPLKLKPTSERDLWKQLAKYDGEIPSMCYFVDGGVTSNFPIDLFHQPGIPFAPTFGVMLGSRRRQLQKIESMFTFLGAVFNTARHTLDYQFLSKNPDYDQLVAGIDTGDHDWLDFEMSADDKKDLFRRGVKEACDFVLSFNWQHYKRTRSEAQQTEEV